MLQMADPKVVALRAQLREAKSDAKRQREWKRVMEGLIKTEKQVAIEESARRKRSWKKEQLPTTSPSPRALVTKPAHSAFQFKAG